MGSIKDNQAVYTITDTSPNPATHRRHPTKRSVNSGLKLDMLAAVKNLGYGPSSAEGKKMVADGLEKFNS
ncbi:MAG: hypothetical protein FWG45_00680 [Oscillospiraceae bacterium]|nr:hypothetical protein [Oscillospiraceae bacterium]